MNTLQQRKLTRQEPDSNPNTHVLCNARTGSLLAYRASRARLRVRDIRERDSGERDIRERDIGKRDIGEREIRERDIGETVTTCRFTEELQLQIDIGGVSGCLSFSQSWPHWARFLRLHSPQKLQPTEGISLRSLLSWWRLWGLWLWDRSQRLWPWGMVAHLTDLLR